MLPQWHWSMEREAEIESSTSLLQETAIGRGSIVKFPNQPPSSTCGFERHMYVLVGVWTHKPSILEDMVFVLCVCTDSYIHIPPYSCRLIWQNLLFCVFIRFTTVLILVHVRYVNYAALRHAWG